MQVTWDPEQAGEEKQEWQFDPDDVPFKDGKQIEKNFGGSFDQWVAGLQMGQLEARGVLLWYMLYLVHPSYKFDDVPNFRVRQLKVEMGSIELTRLWDRVKKMKLKGNERDMFEAQFESDMRDALDREGKYDVEVHIDGNRLQLEGGELPKPA